MQTVSIHETSDWHFDKPYTFTEFLQFDSGKNDPERFLNLGDPYMISLLEGSKFWLADGTFKFSPKTFYHFSTLHEYIHSISVCLPSQQNANNKQTADYLMTWKPLPQVLSSKRSRL